jgi:hypothetical protein
MILYLNAHERENITASGCLRDQVVFLEGGSRTAPIRELHMPITLAQVDALADRLRAPTTPLSYPRHGTSASACHAAR